MSETSEIERTTLVISGDGSLHYRFHSSNFRNLTLGDRLIETKGELESEYHEDKDGVGQCATPDGGTT